MPPSSLETLCPPTDTVIDSPAPAKAHFWDNVARRYAAAAISDMAGYDRSIERTQHWLRPEHRVLEIGCGTGTTALRLAPEVASYVATDVSGHMIAIALQKQAQQPCHQLRFETIDADVGTHERRTYDAVIAFNVLHLVTDLDGTLAACAAALQPGGLLISKTPCLSEMNPLIAWVALPVMRWIGKAPPVHCLNENDLTLAMKRRGLELVTVERHASRGRDARPYIVARKPNALATPTP